MQFSILIWLIPQSTEKYYIHFLSDESLTFIQSMNSCSRDCDCKGNQGKDHFNDRNPVKSLMSDTDSIQKINIVWRHKTDLHQFLRYKPLRIMLRTNLYQISNSLITFQQKILKFHCQPKSQTLVCGCVCVWGGGSLTVRSGPISSSPSSSTLNASFNLRYSSSSCLSSSSLRSFSCSAQKCSTKNLLKNSQLLAFFILTVYNAE